MAHFTREKTLELSTALVGTINPRASLQIYNSLFIDLDATQKGHHGVMYSDLLPNTIRLVQLEHNERRPSIPKCSLRSVRLGSAPYVAVSYTWLAQEYCWYGRPLPVSTQLSIDGIVVSMPSRVALILGTLFEMGIRTVWIDCLSINQYDALERGHQVGRMNRIFEDASEVIIFLGKPTNATDRALKKISSWDPRRVVQHYDGLWGIVQHQYWYRAWILQEIGCSRCIKIVCGDYVLDNAQSYDLIRILIGFEYRSDIKAHLALIDEIARGSRPSMIEILTASREAGCSDPRDALYAKIHLAHDGDVLGEPDYAQSVETLFIRFAVEYIVTSHSLRLLALASKVISPLEIPSWAVDWAPDGGAGWLSWGFPKHAVVDLEMYKFSATFSEDSQELNVKGHIIKTMRPFEQSRVGRKRMAVEKSLAPDFRVRNLPKDGATSICLVFGCPELVVLAPKEDYYVVVKFAGHGTLVAWAQQELEAVGDLGALVPQLPTVEFKIR